MEWTGYALGILHFAVMVSVIVLVLFSHLVYHATWLKLAIFVFMLLVFIQHISLGYCFATVLEKKWSNQEQAPFHMIAEKFLSLFGVTMEQYWLYSEVIEGSIAVFLLLELASIYLSGTWH